MAIQDLTPQLRTRLGRLERLVGLFVMLATLLLLFGLGYYVYQTAQRKGWFLKKMPYYTFVRNAAGLKVGDKVKLMGFDAGEIIEITAQPPDDVYFNVYVRFRVKEPYYGYLWEDSRAKVAAGDFLGNRYIEVTKGTNGSSTYREENGVITGIWDDKTGTYQPFSKQNKGYWLHVVESPALGERLEKVVSAVEAALPDFLALTNKLNNVLTRVGQITQHADELLVNAQPIVTNFALITANLSGPKGSLGEWLFPTNINLQLQNTLVSAQATLTSAETNLNALSGSFLASLENVATMTSNLNAQVQANGLVLTEISELIVHTDEMVQGLKRHWLLKSSFGASTNAPARSILQPRLGGEK